MNTYPMSRFPVSQHCCIHSVNSNFEPVGPPTLTENVHDGQNRKFSFITKYPLIFGRNHGVSPHFATISAVMMQPSTLHELELALFVEIYVGGLFAVLIPLCLGQFAGAMAAGARQV